MKGCAEVSQREAISASGPRSPLGQVLRGHYVGVFRSDKGKIKGLRLQTGSEIQVVKLPKYLRPILVRELVPGMPIEVWGYPEEAGWRGMNVMPWVSAPGVDGDATGAIAAPKPGVMAADCRSAPASLVPSGDRDPQTLRLQICTKGKCFKAGGQRILETLQAEVAANPDLRHVDIEAVGCLKACKSAPNLRLKPTDKLLSRMTPAAAKEWLAQCQ